MVQGRKKQGCNELKSEFIFLYYIIFTEGQKLNLQNSMDWIIHMDSNQAVRNERKKEYAVMDYVNAFWVGGLICALVQILMEKTKMLPGRIMVLLVVLGAVISVFGWYEPFQEFAGAGASVPLLGFGNMLMKGVKEAIQEQGFLGLFAGGFKSAAVGTASALIFGYLASLIFKPKMKK